MKLLSAILGIYIMTLVACQSKPPNKQPATQPSDTSKFYPLRNFFTEEIQYVDLRSFPIYRVTVKDGKKDSSAISKEEFISLAGIFLERDISDPVIKALYKETVFHDLSTGSITLNYTPVNNDARVQNIDVLLDEQTNIVKRVFIRSVYKKADTSISEQCNWKAGKSFQVNRSFSAKNGYASTELNYVNWNDTP
jgi:hypothetical protein